MYAGIEGAGADDAWYETSLCIEHCRVIGTPYAGGASDIYKCFDQLPRSMVYHLAHVAGLPDGILTAFFVSLCEMCQGQKHPMDYRNPFTFLLGGVAVATGVRWGRGGLWGLRAGGGLP